MRFSHLLHKQSFRPDITPLIDVVFLLLIFFMLGSSFVYSAGITVTLPKASSAHRAITTNMIEIKIDEESRLFFDDKQVNQGDIEKLFSQCAGNPVSICADKKAPFGAVIAVWDAARKNALEEVTIRTGH